MKKKRFIYYDILKIICTIFVIYSHSHWYIYGSGRLFTLFHLVFCNISKIAVPIFLMITGALMLRKKTTYAEILKKRIPRIYLGMLLTTVFGCFFFKLDIRQTLIKSIFGGQTGNLYWLWYIYLLMTLYLLTPIIKKTINKFKNQDYFVFFVIFLVVPSVIYYFSNFFQLVLQKYSLMEHVFDQFLYLTYIGYFVFGYYISKIKIDKLFNKKAFVINLIGFSLGMLYLCVGYINTKKVVELFNNTISTVLMATSTFINFKYYFEGIKNNTVFSKFIIIFSDSTFGVYLFHLYLIEYLMKTNFITCLIKYNVYLGYFLLVFITYFGLSIVFYFIRKIPLFKKIF